MAKYDWNAMKESLQKGLENKKTDYNDPREWKLQRDENENGTAIIRLLPGKSGNTPPIVRIYEHSTRIFNKNTNKYRYYINASPSTINKPCPISDLWYELGSYGTDEAKEYQKMLSRSTKFVSNILVVNDPSSPENNGKVFYWKYGVKLFEKFNAALEPTESQIKVGKKPLNLFDPLEGANVMLQTKKVAGFVNYDETSIEAPSKLFNTYEEADVVINEKCIDLTEFISEDAFKTYDELLKSLKWVIAGSPLEDFCIRNGSKIITSKYTENKSGTQNQPGQEAQITQPTQPTQAAPQTIQEPVQSTQTIQEPVQTTRVDTQPAQEPQTSTNQTTDQEILDMINSL